MEYWGFEPHEIHMVPQKPSITFSLLFRVVREIGDVLSSKHSNKIWFYNVEVFFHIY
jgi:hypothetical protein